VVSFADDHEITIFGAVELSGASMHLSDPGVRGT